MSEELQPTPETDAHIHKNYIVCGHAIVCHDFAQKLERERDQARRELAVTKDHAARLQNRLSAEEAGADNLLKQCDELRAQLAAITAERDEVKQKLCNRPAVIELAASQQEVARLRDALQKAMDEYDKGGKCWHSCEIAGAMRAALSATPDPVCTDTERRFPMQYGPSIPWSFAELLYVGYSACYGDKQSLEGLAQRGGFGWSEIEHFWCSKAFRAAIDAEIERTKGAK